MGPESKRKLAAIVFTDIVGFTKLSSENEPRALELLETQRNVLQPLVKKYKGEWLKEIGDGLLLTFPTASAAVSCSIDIQKAAKVHKELILRIGIHEGEITFTGGDIIGDDVNVASRIEPFSAPGGIAISGKIQQNISSLPDYETKFIGQPNLKGVRQKVEVHCISSHDLPVTDLNTVKAKLDPNKSFVFKKFIFPITGVIFTLIGGLVWFLLPLLSLTSADDIDRYEKKIAVLYLENKGMKGDSYFADGLTEEIISRLSRVKTISVTSRFDVADYRNKQIDLDAIEKDLKIDFVLTGSIIRSSSKVKITVELVDIKDRSVPWGQSYEKNIDDLFSIQDEVAINIVNNLDIEISTSDQESVLMDPAASANTFDMLLQAKRDAYNLSQDQNMIDIMIEKLDEIVKRDPSYADALSTRSLYRLLKYWYGGFWNMHDSDEGQKLINSLISDCELALKYDRTNTLALTTLPIAHMIHIWTIPKITRKIFTARKALVGINDLKDQYPEHYMTSFAIGMYHRLRSRMASLSSDADYDVAVELLKKSAEQSGKGVKNNLSDPMVMLIYEESMRQLSYFQETYSDYSDALFYYGLLFDLYKNEMKIERLAGVIQKEMEVFALIGDYESSLDKAIYLERTANQIRGDDDKKNWYMYAAALGVSNAYIKLGEPQMGLDLLQEIDTANISKERVAMNSHFDFNLLFCLGFKGIGVNIKAIDFINKSIENTEKIIENVKGNEWHLYLTRGNKIFANTLLALLYIEIGNSSAAEKILANVELDLEKQTRLMYQFSIETPFNLHLAYRQISKNDLSNKYLNISIDQMAKTSEKLSPEHRNFFTENIATNKKLKSLKKVNI